MMNRSTSSSSSYPSSDPYISSAPNMMMSFASYQEEWNTQANDQNPMIPDTNFDLQPAPPLAALPLMNMNATSHHSFPFYSPLASDQYHHTFIKREERTTANLCGCTCSSARIGLNLGHRTYFSSGDALTIDRMLTARAYHQQLRRCQAEGCKADLSGSKHYHRRHKVCEFHSKATVVIANGMQQRFCQQCSRFHVLAEFDESKRSCRKRLADHNRRRRKPPQNTTSSSSDKTKVCTTTTTTSEDYSPINCTTATTATNGGGFEENQGDHNKAILFLGGGSQQQGLYNYHHHFSSSASTSNNNFYHQQSIFGSTTNGASHQSTNGLHLGHSNMFEVDFM